ncbi:MAG TPA: tripartite tricarboxylate transporter substrate-binding protein, partial [Xanthobacteraceae bacterium]
MRSNCKVAAIAAILTAVIAMPGAAQSPPDYPSRPISLLVPYAAGGVADVGMRILGEKLSSRLNAQFVIENRPGAGGVIAAQAGASASPDGYTLL